MPLRQDIEPLKQLCLSFITSDLSIYSSQDLENLPLQLREDLLHYNYCKWETREKPWEIFNRNSLIKANMNKLYVAFDSCRSDIMNRIQVCTSLTYLECTAVMTEPEMNTLVHSIPNIVVLKMIHNRSCDGILNDDILEAMGNNCLKLEIFTLQYCCKVTDDGIRRFCQSKSGGTKIKHLCLGYKTKVTNLGWLLALQNLKELKILDHTDVIETFEKLYQDLEGSTLFPIFQLCKLPMINMKNRPSAFFDFVIKCCPNVFSLKLNGEISDFSNFGSKLTRLQLVTTKIDLESIGLSCPNLEKLHLEKVEFIPLERISRKLEISFKKLKKLVLNSKDSEPISPTHLKFLLQNCLDLEYLDFQYNSQLEDDLMIGILHGVNPLRRLTDFHLYHCIGLTGMLVMELLHMKNELRMLKIVHCGNITVDDRKEIWSYIKKNNYSVTCVWMTYC